MPGPEEAENRLRELMDLVHFSEDVTLKVHGAASEAEVLRLTNEAFAASSRYFASVLLLNENRTHLTVTGPTGYPPLQDGTAAEIAPAYEIELSRSLILSRVVLKRQAQSVDVMIVLAELLPAPLLSLVTKTGYAREKRSLVLAPLERAGEVSGVLAVLAPDLADYYLPTVVNLARHIGQALETQTKPVVAAELPPAYQLLDAVADGVLITDYELRIIYANKAFGRMHDISPDEAVGRNWRDFIPLPYRGEINDQLAETRERSAVLLGIYETPEVSGRKYWLEAVGSACESEGQPAVAVLLRDITRYRQTETELRRSERGYRELIDNLPQSVFEIDSQGGITFLNPHAFRVLGLSEAEFARGLRIVERLIPEDRERARRDIQRRLQGEVPEESDYTVFREDGSRSVVSIYASRILEGDQTIGLRGVMVETTAARQAAAERAKTDKLESVGTLAAGLAHDFNNMLTGILGNISLAKTYLSPDDKVYELLTESEQSSLRAKEFTSRLLPLAPGGAPLKQKAQVAVLIRDWVNYSLRGSQTRSTFSLPEDLWPVEVDREQFGQVISNLVANADQSMQGAGNIVITAENTDVGQGQVSRLAAGRYVKISVTDQGPGIPREHLARIFDPFFTTGEAGRGLGLTIAYSIIQRHGGHVMVDSEPGVGTTFTIYLPVAEVEPSSE